MVVYEHARCRWTLETPALQSWGALAVCWSAQPDAFPSPDVRRPLVSCSRGRKAGCASTSCRMYRSPWTFSNTDRSENSHTFQWAILSFQSIQKAVHGASNLTSQYPGPFQVKLVNIRNDDIADGNPKLTLGLIWTIILHFQVMWDPFKDVIWNIST